MDPRRFASTVFLSDPTSVGFADTETNSLLFKKLNGEKKIIFHYHDALSKEAIVSKSFPDSETLETYWDQLIRNW